jgi:hypothetical protein
MPRPLLISYGGGHANIIAAVAHELVRRRVAFDLIGLTTAFAAFQRAGLVPRDVTTLVDPVEDAPHYTAVERYLPAASHPDITPAQTHAYFALGFADLVRRFGKGEAHRRIAAQGRKAFEPTSMFVRHFTRCPPSLVVATTSPRFELAAIRAARRCRVPSLAVGDHFLVGETAAITSGDYADHLVVLAEAVAERLRGTGGALPQLHVCGNPAFDALAPAPQDAARRAALRERLGFNGKRVLFWPLGGGAHSGSGERLLPANEAVAALEPIAQASGDWTYLLRAHPNWPVAPGIAQMCPADFSPEDCLLVSDLVVAESTTLGLQALLRGIPVIAFGHADLTQYPHFGWASLAHSTDELRELVLRGDYAPPPPELARLVGGAAARVADLIESLHTASLAQRVAA